MTALPPDGLPKFDRSVSLLAWAYNEEASIEGFLARAVETMERTVEDFEIVVVDDGSSDSTPEILAAEARRDPRIRVVTHPRNLNVGLACRTAIASARKDYLFWQTVDWSYDLSRLRSFLELLRHHNVVQGARWPAQGDGAEGPLLRRIGGIEGRSDNRQKAVVSLINYWVLRLLFGVRLGDFQNVTFYPTELIQSVPLQGRSSFINPECLLRVIARDARIIEVPIGFIQRQQGVAKGTKPSAIFKSLRDISIAWLTWGWRYRFTVAPRSDEQISRIRGAGELDREILRLGRPLVQSAE